MPVGVETVQQFIPRMTATSAAMLVALACVASAAFTPKLTAPTSISAYRTVRHLNGTGISIEGCVVGRWILDCVSIAHIYRSRFFLHAHRRPSACPSASQVLFMPSVLMATLMVPSLWRPLKVDTSCAASFNTIFCVRGFPMGVYFSCEAYRACSCLVHFVLLRFTLRSWISVRHFVGK